jgi:hypothetical protein
VLITRKSALGTGPVSASYLADYLGRHQRGISLEHIRRDRILHEALATGADRDKHESTPSTESGRASR